MDIIPALSLVTALCTLLYVRRIRHKQAKTIQLLLNQLHSMQWTAERGIPADMGRKHLISAQSQCRELSNKIADLITKLKAL